MRLLALAAALALAVQPAAAQVKDPSPSAGDADTKTLAEGWSSLAAGKSDAAVKAADKLLVRRPWNHAALALKIEGLATRDVLAGLDAYEAWQKNRGPEDVGLLEPIARAIVLDVARRGDPDLRREAVRLLREARVTVPPADATRDSPDSVMADAALAAQGDAAAARRLEAAAAQPSGPNRTRIIEALETAGPAGTKALITILGAPSSGPERGLAAAALGRMRAEPARPALLQAIKDPDPFVRVSSAVALARMGDDTGRSMVEDLLASPVPDLRIMAAEAWNGQPGPWVEAIRPLLDNPDGLVRFQAAELVAPVDPEAARRVLEDAATNENPAIRAEAGRIATSLASQTSGADLAALRRLLRDSDMTVRLRAAGAVLAASRHVG